MRFFRVFMRISLDFMQKSSKEWKYLCWVPRTALIHFQFIPGCKLHVSSATATNIHQVIAKKRISFSWIEWNRTFADILLSLGDILTAKLLFIVSRKSQTWKDSRIHSPRAQKLRETQLKLSILVESTDNCKNCVKTHFIDFLLLFADPPHVCRTVSAFAFSRMKMEIVMQFSCLISCFRFQSRCFFLRLLTRAISFIHVSGFHLRISCRMRCLTSLSHFSRFCLPKTGGYIRFHFLGNNNSTGNFVHFFCSTFCTTQNFSAT